MKKPKFRESLILVKIAVCPECDQDLDIEAYYAGGEDFCEYVCRKTANCDYRFNKKVADNEQ